MRLSSSEVRFSDRFPKLHHLYIRWGFLLLRCGSLPSNLLSYFDFLFCVSLIVLFFFTRAELLRPNATTPTWRAHCWFFYFFDHCGSLCYLLSRPLTCYHLCSWREPLLGFLSMMNTRKRKNMYSKVIYNHELIIGSDTKLKISEDYVDPGCLIYKSFLKLTKDSN